jgi:NTE family protein
MSLRATKGSEAISSICAPHLEIASSLRSSQRPHPPKTEVLPFITFALDFFCLNGYIDKIIGYFIQVECNKFYMNKPNFIKQDTTDSSKTRPKIGVVVGSGGLKTISSIPLFEFLHQARIDVDLLIGCSGGSIFSGIYALRNDALHMREIALELWQRELFQKIDFKTLFSIAGLPFSGYDKSRGMIKPHEVHKTFKKVFGDNKIENQRTRLMLQSTDLITGEPVLLSSGLLWDAVYASSALFPILPPIYREGRWLIDGAYSAPVPILEAVNRNMDVIIAMSYEERMTEDSDNFIAYFIRCIMYQQTSLTRNQLALSIDLHHHEIIIINVVFNKHVPLKQVDFIPAIIQAGQDALDEKKDEILAAIKNYK